ncbi:MAG TPA: four helix bundle protein [Patescibacteria group bacterium]|nr:four helix bundle protein [Patescibacteria group bacterium]
MPIHSFKDLRIWREAHVLALQIYAVTREFPSDERFGLISQLRRAAISVPSNIAEGFSRSPKEYANFLSIAGGSAREIICQCLIAKELGFMNAAESENLATRYDGLAAGIHACITIMKRRSADRH